ncbi:MAG: helix-turn-helix transcriptional regulator [Paludibacteraceae bacterium]|nr:helix-turn-helix transcriptional regulator [Paludibacteraceae bacterium]
MAFNLDKLQAIAKPRSENSIKKENFWNENKEWLVRSKEIALAVRFYLEEQKLTQLALAEKMGVSAPYIAKIMKGNENLTLETICKLEKILNETLITTAKPYQIQILPIQYTKIEFQKSEAEKSKKIKKTLSESWCASANAVA